MVRVLHSVIVRVMLEPAGKMIPSPMSRMTIHKVEFQNALFWQKDASSQSLNWCISPSEPVRSFHMLKKPEVALNLRLKPEGYIGNKEVIVKHHSGPPFGG